MKSETRDGMQIDWDAPIRMDDGVVMRADVFRPIGAGKYPAVLSYGPYAKGLAFQEGYKSQWVQLEKNFPDFAEGSTNKYQNWELVDPEKWVPDGYAIVRVDSRGAGRSPGFLDPWSPRESKDFYEMHRMGRHAELEQRQGRAARDLLLRHEPVARGGTQAAAPGGNLRVGRLVRLLPRGLPARQQSSDFHGQLVSAPGQERAIRRRRPWRPQRRDRRDRRGSPRRCPTTSSCATASTCRPEIIKRPLLDEFYRDRSGKAGGIDVPVLSAGNWGGQGLHPRGNIESYLAAGSKDKWLEIHGDTHFSHFYSKYGETLQKKFFGHFLKGEHTGWDRQPKVALNIRRPGEKFELRAESEWPLARTQWTKYYLQPNYPSTDLGENDEFSRDKALATTEPKTVALVPYDATGDGVRFMTPPMTQELEITGPVAAKLWLSSNTRDADVFLVLSVFEPNGKEVAFIGSNDPRTPVGLGWLRASHRKLDPKKTLPYRPYHTHDEEQPLMTAEPVELDIEYLADLHRGAPGISRRR